jgi:NADH-quinone oxidoreductase subunit N
MTILFNSLFFFNIENLFLLNIFFLVFFILGKGITKNLWLLIKVRKSLIFFLIENITHFIIYFFLTLIHILFYLYDKRFFFFNLIIYNDNFILFSKFLILFTAIIIIIFSSAYLKNEVIFKSFEYYVLFLLSILSMLILVSVNDLLSLYLAIELQSLALYVLASFKQNSIFSIEAGLKYFILGTFSSGLLIFGSSLIYGFTGITNFYDLHFFFQQNFLLLQDPLLSLGFLFFFSSLLFKFTAVPFHMWAPDVYQGAPTIMTFFFSIVPKITFLSLLTRIVYNVFPMSNFQINFLFLITGILSLLIGSFSTIYQTKIKRLLAYSSITNVGYFLLALSVNQIEGLISGFFFLIVYIFVMTGIFIVILNFRYNNNKFKLKNITELFALINTNFLVGFILVVNLFSLIGLPPLGGFIAKFYLFFNSLSSEFFIFFLIAIVSSILASVVYLRLVRLTLFNRYSNFIFLGEFSRESSVFLMISLLFNLIFFIYSDFLFKLLFLIFSKSFLISF